MGQLDKDITIIEMFGWCQLTMSNFL